MFSTTTKNIETHDGAVKDKVNENKKSVAKTSKSSTKKNRRNQFKQERKNLIESHKTITCAVTSNLEKAKQKCREKVEKIAKEHRELNRKFRDREFDLLVDRYDCMYGKYKESYPPSDVKRILKIFKNPQFFIDGVEPNDIQQGFVGDCWFIAALGVVTNIRGLLETICVARDEEVGVYGFIFFKDGDWVSTVVDDQLFTYGKDEKGNSKLSFAQCSSDGETWLPLIEKAYAKIHGDYESIEGGWTGEGIVDLTGGVYSFVRTTDILDPERYWKEELVHLNKQALFAVCHIKFDPSEKDVDLVKGLWSNHAYSVLRVMEIEDGIKLVQIRNPHGTGEWTGPWSDGSKEWTPERMTLLNHRFGDDGAFWMTYEDFLDHWNCIDKVRIFDSSWTVYTTWINYNVVPKSDGKFILTIPEESELIIVLQKPDNRYIIEDQKYDYLLSFRVYEQGSESYLVRSQVGNPYASRSINQEVKLSAGTYEIIPQITRTDNYFAGFSGKDDDDEGGDHGPKDEELANIINKMHDDARKKKEERARKLGKDIDDDSEEVEETPKEFEWELPVGIRIYSKNKGLTLEGYEGEYPKQAESVEEKVDPEGVDSVLAEIQDQEPKKDEKDKENE